MRLNFKNATLFSLTLVLLTVFILQESPKIAKDANKIDGLCRVMTVVLIFKTFRKYNKTWILDQSK